MLSIEKGKWKMEHFLCLNLQCRSCRTVPARMNCPDGRSAGSMPQPSMVNVQGTTFSNFRVLRQLETSEITSKKDMTTTESITLHFEEIRRRSKILWSGITPEFYQWRPDVKALSCSEMIRHVLETETIYRIIIVNRGGHAEGFLSPWKDRPFVDPQNELEFAVPFRKQFLETIHSFKQDELTSIEIVREGRKTRTLVDFLYRCAYHEAVHTGQFLSYLRTLGLDRPNIWD